MKLHPIQVSFEDLKNFLVHIRDEKGYAPSTVEGYFSSLTTFYDFLEWEGMIEKNLVPMFRKRYLRYYKDPRPASRQLIGV